MSESISQGVLNGQCQWKKWVNYKILKLKLFNNWDCFLDFQSLDQLYKLKVSRGTTILKHALNISHLLKYHDCIKVYYDIAKVEIYKT